MIDTDHQSDMAAIEEALVENAKKHGLTTEYNQFIAELNQHTTYQFSPLVTNWEITQYVTLRISRTIEVDSDMVAHDGYNSPEEWAAGMFAGSISDAYRDDWEDDYCDLTDYDVKEMP